MQSRSALRDWTPAQIAQAKAWAQTWQTAGEELERIRRQEIRQRDNFRAIQLLCDDHLGRLGTTPPRLTSGLVEQQRWFMRAFHRE